jgi:hypothetical protein
MTYYIIPKNNSILKLHPTFVKDECEYSPKISHSVLYYKNIIQTQIDKLTENKYFFDQAVTHINPYEFIFSKIPLYKFGISKIKSVSNTFYELIEISHTCNIFDIFKYNQNINIYHIGNIYSFLELLNITRDFKSDKNIFERNIDNIVHSLLENNENDPKLKFDIMYFEVLDSNSLSECFKKMLYVLFIILNTQNINGTSIIKIDNMDHIFIIDMLYILNNYYDKCYIIKPTVSSINDTSRYVICKGFSIKEYVDTDFLISLQLLVNTIFYQEKNNLYSLLNIDIPYYFLNKIEEINIIIGQQQLEFLFQVINILKHKNKDDKFETLKKNNIYKCIQWCEKYQIPHNKIQDKTNIFNQNIQKNMFNGKNDDETQYEDVCII